MSRTENPPAILWWKAPLRGWVAHFAQREERVLLFLSILIGALTGLAVVAFIALTERLGMRLYPVGSAAWRRVLIPVTGSLAMGYLLFRYFPNARGQRSTPDKSGSLRRRWRHYFAHGVGKILLHFGHARERDPARARRAFRPSRRRHRFLAGPPPGTAARAGEVSHSSGNRSRDRSRV